MDLDAYRHAAESFASELELEYHRQYAGLQAEYEIEPIYERHGWLFSRSAVESLRERADAAEPGTDAARQSRMLMDFAVEGFIGEETNAVEETIAQREAALTVSAAGRRSDSASRRSSRPTNRMPHGMAHVSPGLPFEFRHLGDIAVTEGYAFLFQYSWPEYSWPAQRLRERYGAAWFEQPAAGEALRKVWSDGQRLSAEELLAELPGEQLDFRVLLRQHAGRDDRDRRSAPETLHAASLAR